MSLSCEVKSGVRQGCVMSPLLFHCFMDKILREAQARLGGGLHIEYSTGGSLFLFYWNRTKASACGQDVLYANDVTLIAEARKELHMLDHLDEACTRWGMRISASTTKIFTAGEQQTHM